MFECNPRGAALLTSGKRSGSNQKHTTAEEDKDLERELIYILIWKSYLRVKSSRLNLGRGKERSKVNFDA